MERLVAEATANLGGNGRGVSDVSPGANPNEAVIETSGDGEIRTQEAIESHPTCGFETRIDFLTAVVEDGRQQVHAHHHKREVGRR